MSESMTWCRDRIGLVTGASSGIGRAVALALGRAGARVGVNYRSNAKDAGEVVSQIAAAGGQAVAIQADVSEPADVGRMFAELESAFGPGIDMLVNNAGVWMDKRPVTDVDDGMWERMFAVNARSVFLCCRQAVRVMIKQGHGSICNVGSLAGHTGGGGGTVPYAAAKAAVHVFTRGLAREVGSHGVRVNAIAPGMVDTPMLDGRVPDSVIKQLVEMTPVGRFATPEEMVPAVILLLSPEAAFITGEIIEVNGGMMMR